MALECAFCDSKEEVKTVCHHCGKPLCARASCRVAVDGDPAFSGKVTAYHCKECARKYHGKQAARQVARQAD